MNSTLVKVISGIVALFILAYVGFQVYQHFYSPYETETVVQSVIADTVEVQGIMLRDEQVLTEKKSGVVSNFYANGSKVAKNTQIAEIYQQEEDVANQYQIKQLDKELAVLKDCQEQANAGTVQTDALNKQINEGFLQLVGQIETQSFEDLEEIKYDLLTSLNKLQITVGTIKDFSARIKELTQEKNQLQKEISKNPKTITTPVSGYFVNETDGFETSAKRTAKERVTVQRIEKLLAQEPKSDDTVIGKIILTHHWDFAAVIPSSEVLNFKTGAAVSLDFSTLPQEEVSATITDVITDKDAGKSVVLFSGTEMNAALSTLRIDRATVSFQNNRGLKVSKDALHIVEGEDGPEKGVYCILSGEMRFKKVDIVFETEDYILSAVHQDDSEYLQMYDDVVIKGKDLYDKKPVD